MGRPIKSKYFGTQKGVGTGGSGVASVTVVTGDSDAYESDDVVVIGAPTIVGGTQATGTIVVDIDGAVTAIVITDPGSGYATPPTVTITTGTGTQTTLTLTAVLTASANAVISCSAWIPAANGGASAVAGDIDEQVASKKYRVQTAQGTGPCTLVTAAPAAGQMTIGATDDNGSTYFVKKLTARRAVLVQNVVNGSFLFATNEAAGWNLDAANSTDVVLDTI